MIWTLDDAASVPLWRPEPSPRGVRLAFTTRRGGVSLPPFDSLNLGRSTEDDPAAVAENRRLALVTLGLDPRRLATAGQVHGSAIAEARDTGVHPAVDTLVTRTPGLAIAVTAADCLPLLLYAPGAVAAVHSGWRGTAEGAPAAAVRALCAAAHCDPSDLTIALGPSIRACCYEVGPEVAEQFPAAAVRPLGHRFALDLTAAARLQLVEAGVPNAAIAVVPACTACDATRYYSHRRDGGKTGRHWAIAALLETEREGITTSGPGV